MKKLCYLVVEGQHDVAFVGRLLRQCDISLVSKKSSLDPFWHVLIPKAFPIRDDLLKRIPIPSFFENDTHSIAIHSAQGITRLTETLGETLSLVENERLLSYGFLLDADQRQTPIERLGALIDELGSKKIILPQEPMLGEVVGNNPRFGVYVLPDNHNQGTLEDVLINTAEVNYSQLSSVAQIFLQSIDVTQLNKDDLEEIRKPAGRKKAHVSSMASILKPGKAIQNSIQDNRWLCEETFNLPIVKSIYNFLLCLFDLT